MEHSVNWDQVRLAEIVYFAERGSTRWNVIVPRADSPFDTEVDVFLRTDNTLVICGTGKLTPKQAKVAVKSVYPRKTVEVDIPEMEPGMHVPGTHVPGYHADPVQA